MADIHSADTIDQVERFTPDTTSRVRTSASRADRLRAFICGHLPSDTDVEVVLTPAVKTAAVLPAEADALVRSDATELERQQAVQLLESVDAAFLMLVTTDPAPIDRIPVNDQLTADHAHQFRLAFHELLHILKTAIGPIAELLESGIEPIHHRQVHDLINIIEDGAIEQEAIEVATKALARFAVATEGLGIDIAIVDFIDSHARFVKPFSVETRHIQAALLDADCGGGTPLADALELAIISPRTTATNRLCWPSPTENPVASTKARSIQPSRIMESNSHRLGQAVSICLAAEVSSMRDQLRTVATPPRVIRRLFSQRQAVISVR